VFIGILWLRMQFDILFDFRNSPLSSLNASNIPGKSIQGEVEHIEQVDKGAWRKHKFLVS
jgi:hypothetical protein